MFSLEPSLKQIDSHVSSHNTMLNIFPNIMSAELSPLNIIPYDTDMNEKLVIISQSHILENSAPQGNTLPLILFTKVNDIIKAVLKDSESSLFVHDFAL